MERSAHQHGGLDPWQERVRLVELRREEDRRGEHPAGRVAHEEDAVRVGVSADNGRVLDDPGERVAHVLRGGGVSDVRDEPVVGDDGEEAPRGEEGADVWVGERERLWVHARAGGESPAVDEDEERCFLRRRRLRPGVVNVQLRMSCAFTIRVMQIERSGVVLADDHLSRTRRSCVGRLRCSLCLSQRASQRQSGLRDDHLRLLVEASDRCYSLFSMRETNGMSALKEAITSMVLMVRVNCGTPVFVS